jgi:hypothetical protein
MNFLASEWTDYLNPLLWGAPLWRILYALTEHLGNNSQNYTKEARSITFLIGNLGAVLPCKECQRHYHNYYYSQKISVIWYKLVGEDIKKIPREWLWKLHNSIRKRNGQPIIVTSIEQLDSMYKGAKISKEDLDIFYKCAKSAIEIGIINEQTFDLWWNKLNDLIVNTNALFIDTSISN